MIARSINGELMTVTRARLGSGTVSAVNLNLQTDVTNPIRYVDIESAKRVTDGIQCSIKITPSAQEYTCKQVGIYASIGGVEQMIAIYQDETGFTVPIDIEEFIYRFNAVIAIDNAANVTATVVSGIYVTKDEFDDIVDEDDTWTPTKMCINNRCYIYDDKLWLAKISHKGRTPSEEDSTYWERVSLSSISKKVRSIGFLEVNHPTSNYSSNVSTGNLTLIRVGRTVTVTGYLELQKDKELSVDLYFADIPNTMKPFSTSLVPRWNLIGMGTTTQKAYNFMIGQKSDGTYAICAHNTDLSYTTDKYVSVIGTWFTE